MIFKQLCLYSSLWPSGPHRDADVRSDRPTERSEHKHTTAADKHNSFLIEINPISPVTTRHLWYLPLNILHLRTKWKDNNSLYNWIYILRRRKKAQYVCNSRIHNSVSTNKCMLTQTQTLSSSSPWIRWIEFISPDEGKVSCHLYEARSHLSW